MSVVTRFSAFRNALAEQYMADGDVLTFDAPSVGIAADTSAEIASAGSIVFAAPSGTSRALTIPRSYTLHPQDFGFSDPDGNAFASVTISSLASTGTLFYDANGSNGGQRVAVTAGQTISVKDVLAGKLSFVSSGTSTASFNFQVRDSAGELDASPNTLTFTPVASNAVNPVFAPTINLSGLALNDGFKISGDGATSAAGIRVNSAGDVNGDGYEDFLIGASGADLSGTDSGAAYVVFGKAGGYANLNLSSLNGTNGFRILGEADGDAFGVGLASAGDLNGDGYGDIIVGARRNDAVAPANQQGAAYVIFGRASGFAASYNAAAITGTTGFKITGENGLAYVGVSVAAGDFNGDGFSDLLIGANRSGTGSAYVVFGKASGFGAIDLTNLGASGFKLSSEASNKYFGRAVSAGDVNGDGFADMVVTAYGDTNAGGSLAGATYVVFGKGSGLGPVTVSATTALKIIGQSASGYLGYSVSAAGDVNGDGFADLIIGFNDRYAGGTHNGAGYVVFGSAATTGTISVSALNGANGFKITGGQSGDFLGYSVASAGDVNGDGFADILVSVSGRFSSGIGGTYLIFGKAGAWTSTVNVAALGSGGFKVVGEASGDTAGTSVSSAGDINGDGYDDLLVGAPGNDAGGVNNAGAAYIIFGRANASNAAPVANADTLAATEDTQVTYTAAQLVSNDTDADGNTLSVASVSNATGGTVVLNANGTVTFTPASNFFGTAGFDYTASDGVATSNTAHVTVNVAAVADTPTITNATTNEDVQSVTGLVLTRNAADGAEVGFVKITGIANGTLYLNNGTTQVTNGSFITVAQANAGLRFTPNADFFGSGSFQAQASTTASDAGLGGTPVTATITVNPVADTPTVTSATTNEDTQSTSGLQVIRNLNDGPEVGFVKITGITNGTLYLNNGTTQVTNGSFITIAQASAGLKFTPAANFSGNGTFNVQASITNTDAGLGGAVVTAVVTVVAVDDAPVAVADSGNTLENATATGNVINNDTDIDGGPKTVVSVNGVAASVGTQVALASGALLTLNADGTYSYNPNGSFNYLVSPATATATGAQNSTATDSFTYALNGGSSATVTITITGVDSAGDQLRGGAGNDVVTGTAQSDLFNLSQGGNDTASGGGGNDGFYFGAAYTSADSVDGGAGTLDQIGLRGDYSGGVTLGATTGVEQLVLLSGSQTPFGGVATERFSYVVTATNANVAAGGVLYVSANTLLAGENFTFSGAAELDGSFVTYGGAGVDRITGGQQNDGFFFGNGLWGASDSVDGQGGSLDQLAIQGNYAGGNAIVFGATQLVSIEQVVVLSGAAFGSSFSYDITLNNANVAAGASFALSANQLGASEVLTFRGGAETDASLTVTGGAGADTIIGGALNDRLFGGAGADRITGGLGADQLTGGSGNDTFLYTAVNQSAPSAEDSILDFTTGDKIDLSGIANFTFVSGNFTGANQVRVSVFDNGIYLVDAETTGDGQSDLLMLVYSDHELTANDFVGVSVATNNTFFHPADAGAELAGNLPAFATIESSPFETAHHLMAVQPSELQSDCVAVM